MTQNFPNNSLYEMDNLKVLRGMNSETVDLIATDPPFNIKRNRESTAGFYVDNWKWGDTGIQPDQWKWNEVHPKWLEEIKDNHTALYEAINAAKHCQNEDTAAFLCFLSVRLLEMRRVLKDTGSIYLHCDHTANSYIRMAMDAIFGKKNFRNEIVWCYTRMSAKGQRQLSRAHDTILWYSVGDKWCFNVDPIRLPYAKGSKAREGQTLNRLGSGYSKEGVTKLNPLGKFPEDWITHIPYLRGNERVGSPDQKPLALYERIIQASSNEGDIVLDPFCGCATTIIAANNLKRKWVGIDRRIDARYHIITRMMGIDKKERERIEKYATNKNWLDKQTEKYEIHYQTNPPKRTDKKESKIPELAPVYQDNLEPLHTHAEMHEILINRFGLKCWGCNFIPPDKRYLHLDHIIPKSEGGSNDIDNRALLCQPCNNKKSNTMSLTSLRRNNKKDGHTQEAEPINLPDALNWTRNYLIKTIRERPHQTSLFK